MGYYHGCAAFDDGRVACWGYDGDGQVGLSTGFMSPVPKAVAGITNAVAVAAGLAHTCALLATGNILCWGWNEFGQLGNGNTFDTGAPQAVTGISNAVELAAGGISSCARLADASIRCWGDNSFGEVGNGSVSETPAAIPETVVGIANATSVSVGLFHSCAGLSDGTVKCWGRNADGELGDGTMTDRPSPAVVNGVAGVVAVAASSFHSCAIVGGGLVRCWGRNTVGELGNATNISGNLAVTTVGITSATSISSYGGHTCVTLSNAGPQCWGFNANGELGHGDFAHRNVPVPVLNISAASATVVGPNSACAILTGGGVACWGWALEGELGNNLASLQPLPVRVLDVATATKVTAGGNHTCALLQDATIRCWGDNSFGQLGDGTDIDSAVPVAVKGLTNVTDVVAGGASTCAISGLGVATCWGYGKVSNGNGLGENSVVPRYVAGITDATSIGVGWAHACARLATSWIRCWGDNSFGQLGDGTTTFRSLPVSVLGITNATEVVAGAEHTCAPAGETVQCWGFGTRGQLGNGTQASSSTPVEVIGLKAPKSIDAGSYDTCVTTTEDTGVCWGGLGFDHLIPHPVPGEWNTGVGATAAIGLGDEHACFLGTDGSAACRGRNQLGQAATGVVDNNYVFQATLVGEFKSGVGISSGLNHTCALLVDGHIECWGDNRTGQAGNGVYAAISVPVAVVGLGSPALPAPPGKPTANAIHTGASVSWPIPNNDGGSPIMSYTATASPGGKSCTARVPTCGVTGLSNGLSYTFTVTATNVAGTSLPSPASDGVVASGATYAAVTPNRVLDSRFGNGFAGPLTTGIARTFQVTDRHMGDAALNIPANAVAVTGNLTVTNMTARGWLSLTPSLNHNPSTSTLNFPVGDNRANGVTIPLGPGGTLSVAYNGGGTGATADAIFDVTGYFVPDLTGATYVALTPNRLLDSRFGNGLSGPFATGVARTFGVTDRNKGNAALNVPATAIAVTGNLTVTNMTAAGWLSLTPTLDHNPATSTLNFPVGDNRANGVTVPLGAGGILSIAYNGGGSGATADAIFDVTGYFLPGSSGAKYQPVAPNRLLDTRFANGFAGPLGVAAAGTFQVTDRHSATFLLNVPADAAAVTGNLTVTAQSAAGWLTLTPTPNNNPPTSTLNFPVADDRANGVTAPLGGGTMSLAFNGPASGNTAQAVFDVTGYFVP
jgi:alpha-tubulin suppressor-like RCC1 family protein